MKENIVEILVFSMFAIVGALFIIIGIPLCLGELNYNDAVTITGTISNISSHIDDDGNMKFDTYVSYDLNGKQFESKLNGYSSDFYEGKEIEIYYNKNNPNIVGVKSLDLMFLGFPLMGLLFFTIGAIGVGVKVRKKNLEKRLKKNGELIYASYIETVFNTSYGVNSKHPYNVICEWNNPADNKRYIFKSKNIWINPQNTIAQKNIKQFPVYFDRNDIRKYIIDVDILNENIVDLR